MGIIVASFSRAAIETIMTGVKKNFLAGKVLEGTAVIHLTIENIA